MQSMHKRQISKRDLPPFGYLYAALHYGVCFDMFENNRSSQQAGKVSCFMPSLSNVSISASWLLTDVDSKRLDIPCPFHPLSLSIFTFTT